MTAFCEVHPPTYRHRPLPTSMEWHHLVPRDWQRALLAPGDSTHWAPGIVLPTDANHVSMGIHFTSNYGYVWCEDGIVATRTCHGNVHAGIEALVHGWKPGDTVASCLKRMKPNVLGGKVKLDDECWDTAAKALAMWLGFSQTVEFLQANKLWGGL